MSTPTVSSPRPLSWPLSRQTLLITGLIVAIVIAVTVLALTAGANTRSASPRLVGAAPRAVGAAQASDAAHFGNPSSGSSVLSSGMGHR
jgi:hypothetical protein